MTSDSRGLGFDYLYNHADRLATLQENSVTVAQYTYNDIGERVIKDVGGTVTHYVFDASGILIAEASGAGATAREYIHLDGLPLGTVVGTTLSYVHADHLGAPQKITDGSKTVVWDGQFTPFGVEHSITGALVANWGMPGQYHDAEAALSYNYRRTYDPALGRYLQSDPIGLAGGLNTYAYAYSSPVMLTDPTGEFAQALALPVGIGVLIYRVVVVLRSGKTVELWLTPAFLASIAVLWERNGIKWTVIDAADFGSNVDDRGPSTDDTSPDPLSEALPLVYPVLGPLIKIIVLSEGDGDAQEPSLDDPESLKGMDPDDVRDLIDKTGNFEPAEPLKKGKGTKHAKKGTKGSDKIFVEDGHPNMKDPLHQGPYVKVTIKGVPVRIPLKGNPTLK